MFLSSVIVGAARDGSTNGGRARATPLERGGPASKAPVQQPTLPKVRHHPLARVGIGRRGTRAHNRRGVPWRRRVCRLRICGATAAALSRASVGYTGPGAAKSAAGDEGDEDIFAAWLAAEARDSPLARLIADDIRLSDLV